MQGEARLRPWEILELTIPEIALLFAPDTPQTRSGGRNMTDEEIEGYARWYWSLKPGQKLALAREGKL